MRAPSRGVRMPLLKGLRVPRVMLSMFFLVFKFFFLVILLVMVLAFFRDLTRMERFDVFLRVLKSDSPSCEAISHDLAFLDMVDVRLCLERYLDHLWCSLDEEDRDKVLTLVKFFIENPNLFKAFCFIESLYSFYKDYCNSKITILNNHYARSDPIREHVEKMLEKTVICMKAYEIQLQKDALHLYTIKRLLENELQAFYHIDHELSNKIRNPVKILVTWKDLEQVNTSKIMNFIYQIYRNDKTFFNYIAKRGFEVLEQFNIYLNYPYPIYKVLPDHLTDLTRDLVLDRYCGSLVRKIIDQFINVIGLRKLASLLENHVSEIEQKLNNIITLQGNINPRPSMKVKIDFSRISSLLPLEREYVKKIIIWTVQALKRIETCLTKIDTYYRQALDLLLSRLKPLDNLYIYEIFNVDYYIVRDDLKKERVTARRIRIGIISNSLRMKIEYRVNDILKFRHSYYTRNVSLLDKLELLHNLPIILQAREVSLKEK